MLGVDYEFTQYIVFHNFSQCLWWMSVLWWNGRLNIVKSSKNISPPRPEGVRQKWWFAQLNCWSVMLQISINCAGEVIISRLNNLTRICIRIYIYVYVYIHIIYIYILNIYIYMYTPWVCNMFLQNIYTWQSLKIRHPDTLWNCLIVLEKNNFATIPVLFFFLWRSSSLFQVPTRCLYWLRTSF